MGKWEILRTGPTDTRVIQTINNVCMRGALLLGGLFALVCGEFVGRVLGERSSWSVAAD